MAGNSNTVAGEHFSNVAAAAFVSLTYPQTHPPSHPAVTSSLIPTSPLLYSNGNAGGQSYHQYLHVQGSNEAVGLEDVEPCNTPSLPYPHNSPLPGPSLPHTRPMKFEQFIKNNSVVMRPSYLGISCECTPANQQQQYLGPPLNHSYGSPNNHQVDYGRHQNSLLTTVPPSYDVDYGTGVSIPQHLQPPPSVLTVKRGPPPVIHATDDLDFPPAGSRLVDGDDDKSCCARCCPCCCRGKCSGLAVSRIICWSIIVIICATFVVIMVDVSQIIFTPPKPDTGKNYYTGS